MKYVRSSFENGFQTIGATFIIILLFTFILDSPELITKNRVYLLILFIAIVIGDFFKEKRKR